MHICPNTFLRAHPTKWQVFLTASKRATFTRITLEVDEWIHPTAGDTSVTISRPGGVAEVAGRSTGLYFTGPLVVFDRPAFIYLERNPPAAGLTVADVMPVVVPNTVDASRDSRDTEVLSARFRAVAQRCR
jgi:hypothetical protein